MPSRSREETALAVLTAARTVVERGWVRNTWYVTEARTGRPGLLDRLFPGRVDHSRVVSACLVGAVMHAAWQQSRRPERAYPAVDALWNTLFETGREVGPLCPPLVRAARVRDLTTWNDANHRTRQDVLRLLDEATDRVRRQVASFLPPSYAS